VQLDELPRNDIRFLCPRACAKPRFDAESGCPQHLALARRTRVFLDSRAEPAVPEQTGTRQRILWADDNADMRHYVARLLGGAYEVLAVPDGRRRLKLPLAAPPDLVLSDVMMPELDGFGSA